MFKKVILATAITIGMVGGAQAATLSGDFSVQVVNETNLNSAQSQATIANFNSYFGSCTDGINCDAFEYSGDIDFATSNGSATTINDWINSAGGIVTDLDASVSALQQSKGSIGDGTATSTFYLFTIDLAQAFDFDITHDDGVALFDDGSFLGAKVGPTSETNTSIGGFNGGTLSILYVASNSDPSILNVNATAVPLPAGLPLLAAGLGSIVALRRRAKA